VLQQKDSARTHALSTGMQRQQLPTVQTFAVVLRAVQFTDIH
jgi:hypothetical protein